MSCGAGIGGGIGRGMGCGIEDFAAGAAQRLVGIALPASRQAAKAAADTPIPDRIIPPQFL